MSLVRINPSEDIIFIIAKNIKNYFNFKHLKLKHQDNEIIIYYSPETPKDRLEELKVFLKANFSNFKFNFQLYRKTIS